MYGWKRTQQLPHTLITGAAGRPIWECCILKYWRIQETLNKIGRLEAEKKWQLALKTYYPFGLNTVPSPKDSGVTPFVITYSATAVEAAKLVKTSFNKLEAKHPNILYKRCVTAFERGQNLRDLLVRSRSGKAPLDNPTVTGSDSSQDLTTLVNALDEV